MRAALGTIQQTLTPEASAVLTHSISDAARRRHAQTTPLHVAATLLSSPSGKLREACVKSHPASSHPLQCRALELCFSVALDRLPAAPAAAPPPSPDVSNALMAALKRAQASQRRRCPEPLQQPLLAVKVELEHLILSILDDPCVSRVMREASFSSVAVKAAVDQSSPSNNNNTSLLQNPPTNPTRIIPTDSPEVKKLIDVLRRSTKKNPILVGESGVEDVLLQLLQFIESNHMDLIQQFKNLKVVHLNGGQNATQLGSLLDTHLDGIVLNLGDIKWLLEGGGAAAMENIGKIARSGGRVWLIGTANCATYLRLQVHHPAVEGEWDLQAVPVSTRSLPPRGVLPPTSRWLSGAPARTAEEVKSKPSGKLLPWMKAADGPPIPTSNPSETGEQGIGNWKESRPKLQATAAAVCTLDLFEKKGELGGAAEVEEYKKLVKCLTEAVSWQRDAAAAVAKAVVDCRLGKARMRLTGSKLDTWLLLMGPDKVGKRRMAAALSEHLFSAAPTVVGLNGKAKARGRTTLDGLVQALRRNPFSVFLLEGVDEADAVVQGSLRRGMERGRLPDSHGREVPLSAAVVVLTASSLPDELRTPDLETALLTEAKLEAAAGEGWRFRVLTGGKRPVVREGLRCGKRRKGHGPSLCLDLNLAVSTPEEEECGLTSSDLTWDSAPEHRRLNVTSPSTALPPWVVKDVDSAVAFVGVEFGEMRRKVETKLAARLEEACGGVGRRSVEVEEDVVDCVVGRAWFAGAPAVGDWFDAALELASSAGGGAAAAAAGAGAGAGEDGCLRLVAVKESDSGSGEEEDVEEGEGGSCLQLRWR